MEFFAKIVKNYNYFSKVLHLRSLTEFLIRNVINFQSNLALCVVWYLFRTLSIIENSDILKHIHVLFKHIQQSCSIFRTLCHSCILRTVPYSKSWHIQNPRYIQNCVKAYSGIFSRLCNARILKTWSYSQLFHIQNVSKFRTRGIFRILFIEAHLGIFRNIQ